MLSYLHFIMIVFLTRSIKLKIKVINFSFHSLLIAVPCNRLGCRHGATTRARICLLFLISRVLLNRILLTKTLNRTQRDTSNLPFQKSSLAHLQSILHYSISLGCKSYIKFSNCSFDLMLILCHV